MEEKGMGVDEQLQKTLEGEGKTSRGRRWALFAALAVAALLAARLAGTGAKKAEGSSWKTARAQRGDLVVTVSATGNLAPVDSIDVGTEVSGTVKAVEVQANDRVKAGQVLVRIDTERLEAQIKKAEAQLGSAKAKLAQVHATVTECEKASKRLARASELSAGRAVSQQDLDAAEAALARAKADEEAAKATVDEAEATLAADRTDLSKATIRAPRDGIVLTRSIEPGQTVAASLSTPVLMTMAGGLSRMELRVSVDEADVGKVRRAQEARFTVDAWPDRTFRARIESVRLASTKVNGVVTYETVLSVDNREGLLRPGMTATAEITVKKVGDALLVPNAALRFTPPAAPDAGAKKSEGLISSLLPHPPKPDADRKPVAAKDGNGTVWAVRSGALSAVSVKTGVTDGKMTQLLSGDVASGAELVVDSADGGAK
jgi:HlyD family secretion protein